MHIYYPGTLVLLSGRETLCAIPMYAALETKVAFLSSVSEVDDLNQEE